MSVSGLDDEIDEEDERTIKRDKNCSDKLCDFNFAFTNARSMSPKVESIIETFNETDVSLMVITETWLHGEKPEEEMVDILENGHGIKIIRRNRKSRGGGVAILHKPSVIDLKEYRFKRKSHELAAAKGFLARNKWLFYIFAISVKPSMSALKK